MLIYPLRRLERWLHQHLFKVGWLLTHDYQTTTILYYTLFLPGVLLHEVLVWLTAGVLNVRAEGEIKWPDKQEIGELRLNFVKLSKKAHPFKIAVISATPLLIAMLLIWGIADSVLKVQSAFASINPDRLESIWAGVQAVLGQPDFWLWFYLIFVLGNTMLPDLKSLRGARILLLIGGAVLLGLFTLGIGEEVLTAALTGPLLNAPAVLSTILLTIIAVDVLAVAGLSLIENSIERVTGHSATFKNGKMITLTRQELLAQREQQIRKERQRAKQPTPRLPAGPPSIYRVSFPLPGAPGQESITPLLSSGVIEPSAAAKPSPLADTARAGASVVTPGQPENKPTAPSTPQRPLFSSTPLINAPKPLRTSEVDHDAVKPPAASKEREEIVYEDLDDVEDYDERIDDDDETAGETRRSQSFAFNRPPAGRPTPAAQDDQDERIDDDDETAGETRRSQSFAFNRPPALNANSSEEEEDEEQPTRETRSPFAGSDRV